MANCALRMYLFYYFRGTGATPELSRHGRPWSSIGRQLLPITRPWYFQRFRALVDRWHCGILGAHLKRILPRVAIVGTKWSTEGHKSLSRELAIQSLISFRCLYLGQIGCQGDGVSRQPGWGTQVIYDSCVGGSRIWWCMHSAHSLSSYSQVWGSRDIEVPSRVDGKRRYLAQVSDFVSWDEVCRVPRHKITHKCKIPPFSIHEWWNLFLPR